MEKESYPWYQSTPLLYGIAISLWGSTWYVIKLQLGVVSPEVSVVYRFIIASTFLFLIGRFSGQRYRFSLQNHLNFMVQGLCLYSFSYIFAYKAGGLIPSGLNAVLFSTLALFNVFNSALFFKKPLSWVTVLGTIIGLIGLFLIFLPDALKVHVAGSSLMGMGFALLGGYISSLGNMFSVKSQGQGIKVLESNAISMTYGTIFSAICALVQGEKFVFDFSFTYVASLLYLSLFGTVATFSSYLTVLGRIGPERAGYPMVLIPVVALIFSVLLEDAKWPQLAGWGIGLMLVGNFLVTLHKWLQKMLLKTSAKVK